ncbi:MAG: hypothetical protein WC217_01075 [Candidatus Paceibacterota bacterium]|jgi:hypothetical protein
MAIKTAQIKRHTTLVEKAKNDKESGAGVGRGNKMESTRAAFRAWLLKPRIFLGKGEHVLNLLGITDIETVELYSIRSQGEFSEKFGVGEPTLSHWKREMQNGNDFKDFKMDMRELTKNVVGTLYRTTLEHGDAPRVMAWMKIVEDWHERFGMEHSGEMDDGLTDEEKATIDRLIEKNTIMIP